ncbi:amylo-alpha-1,6-glucosidase [Mycolicibacterium agri]|uniref:Amylo-alpha-1,6-glucosidase n=1 Tax=Mycolicibacterium agri TaxID=36811 RepID=A0A2A7N3Z3_MYCAG|nr:glycogen debranching N-terminal domain-containing protein [Mycolicibacterium agri]PEG38614.1 amylo-alpha-1,6-glucosidase [Mycolicibacterium agri]GFG53579.1 amylo-alpha-1,6-glucosidase [Mycolicibacterium agri]
MIPGAGVLNAGEPAHIPAGDTVTLVEGGTFCLSDRHGDIIPGRSHGLFFRDARILSRWELTVDGVSPEPLSAQTPEAFTGQFVSRRAPVPGRADSTLLLTRERLVADGMREIITLHNLDREPTVVTLVLHVDGDFADLFAVKEGRSAGNGAEISVVDGELVLRERGEPTRGVTITASSDPIITAGALTWRVVIEPRQQWQTEIVAQPTWGNRKLSTRFQRGQRPERSGPGRKIERWRKSSTNIDTDLPELTAVLQRTESDIGALLMHDEHRSGRSFVAAGAPWFMTLFGRDSLLTAWMALPLEVALSLGTLQQLAETQGRRIDPITEEQPGRIMHEIRRGPDSGDILGGNVYYGSVDATPLFVMLMGEAWRWGADTDKIRALLPAADAALRWAREYGDRDGDGFIEYQRMTDRGLVNQGWKDSFDGVNDAAGRLAHPPIALCEVQAYHYAALRARADLADGLGDTATAEELREEAERLRERFFERFWLPDRGYYAVALDGDKRVVDALTSNVGHCLWAGIAADEHAAAIIERLADPTMDTGFGLRTLASDMGAYNPMSYHNGSVWPHDTAIAVAGLLRYRHLPGAVELAERLANGLIDAATAFGGRLPELFCGFPRSQFGTPLPYPTSCSPQAWASAAPLLLVRSFLGLQPDVPNRRLTVSPRLPSSWGRVTLTDLTVGDTTVVIDAEGQTAKVTGLPDTWSLEVD